MELRNMRMPSEIAISNAAKDVSTMTTARGGATLHTDCDGGLGVTQPGSSMGDWFPLGYVRGDTDGLAEKGIRELLAKFYFD